MSLSSGLTPPVRIALLEGPKSRSEREFRNNWTAVVIFDRMAKPIHVKTDVFLRDA